MRNSVFAAFLAVSSAIDPASTSADPVDSVLIDTTYSRAFFNVMVVKCDDPDLPERHHQISTFDYAIGMDGINSFEAWLINNLSPGFWFRNDMSEGLRMTFAVSGGGEIVHVGNSDDTTRLLARYLNGDWDSHGLPVSHVEELVPGVMAKCGPGF